MTTEFRKEIPYRFNFQHPYFRQVEFTENEEHRYSGPYEKMSFYDFMSQLIHEGIEDTGWPAIKSSKSTYYLRHSIVQQILSLYIEMYKKGRLEEGSFEGCTWYVIEKGYHSEIGAYYSFFISGRNLIEFEYVGLKLKQEEYENLLEMDLLRQPDYLNDRGLCYDEEFDKAAARYWYRKFYKETKLGQILAIQKEMRREDLAFEEEKRRKEEDAEKKQEEKEIRKEEDLAIKEEELAIKAEKRAEGEAELERKQILSEARILQNELMSSVNQKLSLIVLLVLILVVKLFFIK